MDTSEFTDEQIEALQALADGYNDQSVSRRDVMKLVGAGGVGALLGGGGAASAVGQASAGTAQSGQLGTAADPVDVEAEDVNAASVNTEQADITDTFVQASRQLDSLSQTAGTFVTIADTEDQDPNGIQDSSFNINPNESTWYEVEMFVEVFGVSDQDQIRLVIRDVDAGSIVNQGEATGYASGSTVAVQATKTVALTAGTNYKIQVTNSDSSFSVGSGNGKKVGYTFKKSVVHP